MYVYKITNAQHTFFGTTPCSHDVFKFFSKYPGVAFGESIKQYPKEAQWKITLVLDGKPLECFNTEVEEVAKHKADHVFEVAGSSTRASYYAKFMYPPDSLYVVYQVRCIPTGTIYLDIARNTTKCLETLKTNPNEKIRDALKNYTKRGDWKLWTLFKGTGKECSLVKKEFLQTNTRIVDVYHEGFKPTYT